MAIETKSAQKSDEEWMRIYQESGPQAVQAFSEIYRRYEARVLAYLRRRLGSTASKDEIQDIFQKVFFKFHETRLRFDEAYLVGPWIFTLTKNQMIDHLRQSKKHRVENTGIDPDDLPSPVEAKSDLAGMFDTPGLTTDQQNALTLRYSDEASFDEIAKKLGTSSANARQLVSRGLKILKNALGPKKEKLK